MVWRVSHAPNHLPMQTAHATLKSGNSLVRKIHQTRSQCLAHGIVLVWANIIYEICPNVYQRLRMVSTDKRRHIAVTRWWHYDFVYDEYRHHVDVNIRFDVWCSHLHLLNSEHHVRVLQFQHVITLSNCKVFRFCRCCTVRWDVRARNAFRDSCVRHGMNAGEAVKEHKPPATVTSTFWERCAANAADDDRLTMSGEIIERHFIQLIHCHC